MDNSKKYIGAAFLDGNILIKYQVPNEAIHPELRDLHAAMLAWLMSGKELDLTAFWVAHQENSWCPKITDISNMSESAVSKALAPIVADKLRSNYKRLQYREALTRSLSSIDSDNFEAIHSELLSLASDTDRPIASPLSELTLAWKQSQIDGVDLIPRIRTGIFELDNAWILDNGGLHIVAGRTSMGKTSFALNIAKSLISRDIPTLFFSLEMPSHQILSKFYADDDHCLLRDKKLFISDIPALTVEQILMTSQVYKKQFGVQCVVIDYLQRIRTAQRYNNRDLQIGHISSTLKQIAMQLNIPVIACCQLNRDAENTSDCRPKLAHLRESGNIEQDADSVMLLYRSEYYYILQGKPIPIDQENKLKCIIAKQRNGPTGEVTCIWNKGLNTYDNWRINA